jgi:hypothetical protein
MANVPTAASMGLGQGPGKIVPLQGRLNVQASPADFGAQQAQVIGQFGQDIGQAGAQLWRAQQAVEERDATLSANKAGLEAQAQWLQTLEQRKGEADIGAPGFSQNLTKEFDEYRQKTLEGVKSGRYRDLLDQRLQQLGVSLLEDGIQFEGQAKRAKADADVKGSVEASRSVVFLKPEMLPTVLAQQHEVIDSSNLAPGKKAEAKQALLGALTEAAWRGQGERDPRGTLKIMQEREIPGLDYADRQAQISRLQTKIDAEDREAERQNREGMAEAKVALGERADDVLALSRDGKDPGVLPTEQNFRDAFGPTGWQRPWARFQDQVGKAKALGRVTGASIADQDRILLETAPDPAKPNYGQQVVEHNAIRQAVAEIRQQMTADPAGWAVRSSPALAARFQDAGTDPVALGTAISLSLETQRQAGIPETMLQPLPKAQAEQLGQSLATIADPRQQVESIRGHLATIADPAIRRRFAASLEKEGGLPKGFGRAVDALERGDQAAAVRIMTALKSDMKIADKSTRDNVGVVLDNVVAKGGLARVAQHVGQWTGDNRNLARLAEDRALAERLAAYSVSGGMGYDQAARSAAADVWGVDVPVIADENLAAVVLPEGTDEATTQQYTSGLITARDNVTAVLSGEDVRRLIDPHGKGGVITERGAAELLDDWKDQARWINDGDGFALLVPIPRRDKDGNLLGVMMQKLPGADGRPLHWSREQILSNPTSAPTSVDSGLVMPGVGPMAEGGAVDRPRFFSLIKSIESGGRNIIADDPERAPENRATGPMQVMPETARETAEKMGIAELRGLDNAATQAWMLAHPDQAEAIGQHYAGEQLDKYGDPVIAAVAYTAGPGNVDTWLAQFGDPRQGDISMASWLDKVRAAGNPKSAGYGEKVMERLA